MNNTLLKSAIYGFAVADALGVPVEFKARGSFSVSTMTGYGTHDQPAGTWSDDTSMTLATCHSIKKCGKIDLNDLYLRFLNWILKGDYTANGNVFDCGYTTYQALSRGHGFDDLYSNGNGSLMRILPLAFTDADATEIETVSAITHAHPISKEACLLYVRIARDLIRGKDLQSSLNNLTTSNYYRRLKNLAVLPESQIKSTGYVVDTLEASLWSLLTTCSYKEAVLKAVNLGEDTDTVAAVAGGLAGIIYGYDDIPVEWIEVLRNKALIETCLA